MALFGLFGKKDQQDSAENKDSEYFLDQDAAKTFGNIDYMRTPKAVTKTFPTVNGKKGAEITEIVSATEKTESPTDMIVDNKAAESIPQTSFEPMNINTRVDSSMDIFLNMAKNINKK